MPTKSYVNCEATEAAANTLKWEKFELPRTEGASGVVITEIVCDASTPDQVANSTTQTLLVLYAGDKTHLAAAGNIADDDCFAQYSERKVDEAGSLVQWNGTGPYVRDGVSIPVWPDNQGRFYITIGVQGSNNTGTKSARSRIDYEIYD